jgi:hypothetical protein
MYRSMLEMFNEHDYDYMQYVGTLHSVMDRMLDLVGSNKGTIVLRDQDAVDIFLHPARIVRGLLDTKQEHLIEQALDIGLGTAQGHVPIERLKSLRAIVEDGPITEVADCVTWKYSLPEFSYKSAQEIFDAPERKGQDVFLVSIAHGSTRAAFDVCGKYCDLVGRKDAMVLDTLRFSRYKFGDKSPCISPAAASRFLQKAQGRCAMVFDEDVGTGDTIFPVGKMLQELLQKEVFFQVNNINETSSSSSSQ